MYIEFGIGISLFAEVFEVFITIFLVFVLRTQEPNSSFVIEMRKINYESENSGFLTPLRIRQNRNRQRSDLPITSMA